MDFSDLLLRLLAERPVSLLTVAAVLAFLVWNAAVTWTGFRQVRETMATKNDLRIALAELREGVNAWLAESYVPRREVDATRRELDARLVRLEQRVFPQS